MLPGFAMAGKNVIFVWTRYQIDGLHVRETEGRCFAHSDDNEMSK